MNKAGYWAGGSFCLLAILSLSLGLVPLMQAFLYKPMALRIPGQATLDMRLPGTYIGVASLINLSSQDKRKAFNLDYWFSDAAEKDFFKVNKFPPKSYYSEKEDAQTPLFEIIVSQKGKYLLTSDYAIGTEGPTFPVILFHYDADHVRSELIVGAIMFVLLSALGGTLIWKTRSSA